MSQEHILDKIDSESTSVAGCSRYSRSKPTAASGRRCQTAGFASFLLVGLGMSVASLTLSTVLSDRLAVLRRQLDASFDVGTPAAEGQSAVGEVETERGVCLPCNDLGLTEDAAERLGLMAYRNKKGTKMCCARNETGMLIQLDQVGFSSSQASGIGA